MKYKNKMDKNFTLFFDLDNTLIHSYKHYQEGDVCVEWLNGHPQSFMTPRAYKLFSQRSNYLQMIPVTTRSIEQYQRIQWPHNWKPQNALVSNGGILLHENQIDLSWQKVSKDRVYIYQKTLLNLLEKIKKTDGFSVCRMVDDLFLFAKQEKESAKISCPSDLKFFQIGQKIYYFPPGLDKGTAVLRFQKRENIKHIFCAGDSAMDISMLQIADIAFVPDQQMAENLIEKLHVKICPVDQNFGEFILENL